MSAQEAVERLLEAYLLAPVSPAVLDALAEVGADMADMEPETTEDDGNGEDYSVVV